jgi:hypothetical protein
LIVHSKSEKSALISGMGKVLRYKKSLFILILALVFWAGVTVNQLRTTAFIDIRGIIHGLKYYTNINNYLIQPEWEPAHLDINIKFKNFLLLEFLRKRTWDSMMGINVSSQENKRYVKVSLEFGGKRVPAKVRLKGVSRNHYSDDKWSMRVSIRGQNSFLGMKEFSLTHPRRRAMFFYWLQMRTLEREGLIWLRTPLVDVSINGKHKGIYSVEEIPRKELIVNNQRREGVIVRFSQIHAEERGDTLMGASGNDHYYSSALRFSIKTKEAKDESLRQFEVATSLLESFRSGDLKASKVFNIKRYATYLAICDTMNAWHGGSWGNMRFYYDPVLARLEPIPWDTFDEDLLYKMVGRTFRMDDLFNDPESAFFLRLFSDPIFVREYISELVRIASDEYADKLLEDLKDEIEAYNYALQKDYPYKNIQKDIEWLYVNRDYIRKNYLQKPDLLTTRVVKQEPEEITLKLNGRSVIPLDIIGLGTDNRILFRPENGTVIIPGVNQRQQTSRTVRFIPAEGILPSELDLPPFFVNFRLLGTDEVRRITVMDIKGVQK